MSGISCLCFDYALNNNNQFFSHETSETIRFDLNVFPLLLTGQFTRHNPSYNILRVFYVNLLKKLFFIHLSIDSNSITENQIKYGELGMNANSNKRSILYCSTWPKYTAQKMKFSIKAFFSKCDQIRSFPRIWLHLLKKYLMKNFLFCAVVFNDTYVQVTKILV